jgi:N6-adenosine-specific RNA methylase IME4
MQQATLNETIETPEFDQIFQTSPIKTKTIPFLRISEEFEKLIIPLEKDEYQMLEENLLERGVLTPLITWNGYLVDGHHRYKICCNHSLKFPQVEYAFSCQEAVKSFIYKNQCGRRNVSTFQKIEYAKKACEIDLKLEAREKQRTRNDLNKDDVNNFDRNSGRSCKEDMSGRTDRKIGELTGANHDTVRKASKIIDFGTEKLKQEVREKKKSINEGYREIKKGKMESLIGNVPDKTYRVFYADFFEEVDCVNGWDVLHDLSFEDLKSFPMEKFKDKDKNAVCFLWTSLDDFYSTLKVMNSWGFGYRSMFTLEIPRQYKGMYNIENQLVVIVGATKHECLPDLKTPLSSVLDKSLAEENRISDFRKIIDKIYTSGNKIQLFSNNKTPDWDVCDINKT